MKNPFLLIFGVCALLSSCTKFNLEYNDFDGIQSEWLLPIAKTSLGFNDIKEISTVEFDFYLSPFELGYPTNSPVDVPAFTAKSFSFNHQIVDIVHRIDYDSLGCTLSLFNGFPFSLSAGTTIILRNTPDNNNENIILSWEITENIPSGETIEFSSKTNSNFFEEFIYVTIENLGTEGGDNLSFSGTPLSLSVKLDVIDINQIELQANRQIISVDTLSISIEEPGDTFGIGTGGTATIYFDNLLPANQRFQAYFLQNGIVKDSLLSSPGTIVGCDVTNSGDPLSLRSSIAVAPLSWAKWTKLSYCDKMVIHHYLNTYGYSGPYIKANEQCKIDLQLVVDVLLNINISAL